MGQALPSARAEIYEKVCSASPATLFKTSSRSAPSRNPVHPDTNTPQTDQKGAYVATIGEIYLANFRCADKFTG